MTTLDSQTKQIPFALQLHSIQNECVADLPRALEAVAAMGYQGVEFAGYYGYPVSEPCAAASMRSRP